MGKAGIMSRRGRDPADPVFGPIVERTLRVVAKNFDGGAPAVVAQVKTLPDDAIMHVVGRVCATLGVRKSPRVAVGDRGAEPPPGALVRDVVVPAAGALTLDFAEEGPAVHLASAQRAPAEAATVAGVIPDIFRHARDAPAEMVITSADFVSATARAFDGRDMVQMLERLLESEYLSDVEYMVCAPRHRDMVVYGTRVLNDPRLSRPERDCCYFVRPWPAGKITFSMTARGVSLRYRAEGGAALPEEGARALVQYAREVCAAIGVPASGFAARNVSARFSLGNAADVGTASIQDLAAAFPYHFSEGTSPRSLRYNREPRGSLVSMYRSAGEVMLSCKAFGSLLSCQCVFAMAATVVRRRGVFPRFPSEAEALRAMVATDGDRFARVPARAAAVKARADVPKNKNKKKADADADADDMGMGDMGDMGDMDMDVDDVHDVHDVHVDDIMAAVDDIMADGDADGDADGAVAVPRRRANFFAKFGGAAAPRPSAGWKLARLREADPETFGAPNYAKVCPADKQPMPMARANAARLARAGVLANFRETGEDADTVIGCPPLWCVPSGKAVATEAQCLGGRGQVLRIAEDRMNHVVPMRVGMCCRAKMNRRGADDEQEHVEGFTIYPMKREVLPQNSFGTIPVNNTFFTRFEIFRVGTRDLDVRSFLDFLGARGDLAGVDASVFVPSVQDEAFRRSILANTVHAVMSLPDATRSRPRRVEGDLRPTRVLAAAKEAFIRNVNELQPDTFPALGDILGMNILSFVENETATAVSMFAPRTFRSYLPTALLYTSRSGYVTPLSVRKTSSPTHVTVVFDSYEPLVDALVRKMPEESVEKRAPRASEVPTPATHVLGPDALLHPGGVQCYRAPRDARFHVDVATPPAEGAVRCIPSYESEITDSVSRGINARIPWFRTDYTLWRGGMVLMSERFRQHLLRREEESVVRHTSFDDTVAALDYTSLRKFMVVPSRMKVLTKLKVVRDTGGGGYGLVDIAPGKTEEFFATAVAVHSGGAARWSGRDMIAAVPLVTELHPVIDAPFIAWYSGTSGVGDPAERYAKLSSSHREILWRRFFASERDPFPPLSPLFVSVANAGDLCVVVFHPAVEGKGQRPGRLLNISRSVKMYRPSSWTDAAASEPKVTRRGVRKYFLMVQLGRKGDTNEIAIFAAPVPGKHDVEFKKRRARPLNIVASSDLRVVFNPSELFLPTVMRAVHVANINSKKGGYRRRGGGDGGPA